MEVESLGWDSFVEDLTNSGLTDAEVRIAEARTGLCSNLYFGTALSPLGGDGLRGT